MSEKIEADGVIAEHLSDITEQLAIFLNRVLPTLYQNWDWWNEGVIQSLTETQQKRVEYQSITSLSGLDLLGLLRVMDRNWSEIQHHQNLSIGERNYLKEMYTVRNRWAHANSEGHSADDIYRDLDTLQRFARAIEADDKLIERLEQTKAELRASESSQPQQESADSRDALPPPEQQQNQEAEFVLGQIVSLRSNPSSQGAVTGVITGGSENRFKVFIDGAVQTFYTSQLKRVEQDTQEPRALSCKEFHAHLSALQIRVPSLSTLYSLHAARVDFIPYQFRPVLRFIRSDRPRLLIADGVGVGKTIEAGLILRELQARREIRSVLIICPRPLVVEKKWHREMKRFEEDFIALDGKQLRCCMDEMNRDGVWPERCQKIIVPYSLFDGTLLYGSEPKKQGKIKRRASKKSLLGLDPPPRFDLVIVDEAHHICNSRSYNHQAVRYFCDHTEAAVFLTATPVQLGSNDLFVLLNALRPDLIIDKQSFEHMAQPNPFIEQAVSAMRAAQPEWPKLATQALEQAASTPWGMKLIKDNPDYVRVCEQLGQEFITDKERVKMISDTEGLHTFAGIINRTRRRDIGAFTVRKPETVTVDMTPAQQFLHDMLLKVQAEIYERTSNNIHIELVMTTIRRQAASCFFGLVPILQDILNRRLERLSEESADYYQDDDGEPLQPLHRAVGPIQDHIQALLEAAQSLEEEEDPKLQALQCIVRGKQKLANNKVLLFSCFRHTLRYLYAHLGREAVRIGLVHGDTPDEERLTLRARFEKPKEDPDALDLLLSSEIGCEGLDYQFCDCLVNYDLSWNPMRIEQRIGRIDRKGQKSESVAIVNLITSGTIDADIYERCLKRIGVFEQALGASEAILGKITREIKNIAKSYTLTEHERQEKLQQLTDNKIRHMQEQEKLEQKQADLFGIRIPQEQMEQNIAEATSYWLSPKSLLRLVSLYLRQACEKDQEYILGEKALKTLRLSQEDRERLLRDFQKLPKRVTPTYREWANWLKGSEPHWPITFDPACASEHTKAALITPQHPLAKQAAQFLSAPKGTITRLRVQSNEINAGVYPFAIYQWRFQGVKEDCVLQPIARDAKLTEHLLRLLQDASDDGDNTMPDSLSNSDKEDLDAHHHSMWNRAKAEHQRKTRELATYRKESLNTSHQAHIRLLEEQRDRATDQKVQTMRQSQIEIANADYKKRNQELDTASERADIITEAVAYGQIHILEEKTDDR